MMALTTTIPPDSSGKSSYTNPAVSLAFKVIAVVPRVPPPTPGSVSDTTC